MYTGEEHVRTMLFFNITILASRSPTTMMIHFQPIKKKEITKKDRLEPAAHRLYGNSDRKS